ncbi:MAG: hypothetical protein HY735_07260 [Verrucomicrobia bacterium]|nr:hypothetical protein [Verrucomicrobiota bacterium]
MRRSSFTKSIVVGLLLTASPGWAGTVTYNFDTDPSGVLQILGNNPQPWQATGGNPATGGFLALTYPENYQNSHIIFPDLDPGQVVTAFSFSCDLRIGNSSGTRAADGFSINFARANDPVLQLKDSDPGRGFAGDTMSGFTGGENASLPETGSITGIAVSFDTWSGNPLPDGADIEGIIVRVDNKTVLRKSLPTRHGACGDATSLQTGQRDPDLFSGGGDVHMADAWKTLCWQPFSVDLDETAKLTVKWKGVTILDKYQTAYFPTPGRLVFAGRTGGANEQTHVDNLKLTTIAVTLDTEKPTNPSNLKAAEAGVRRILLTWAAATDNSGRVAYQLEKDGQLLSSVLTEPKYEDTGLKPNTKYSYRVRATDVSQNTSDWTSIVSATTVTDVDDVGFLLGEIYTGITGTPVQGLYDDSKFPANPDQGVYLNGLSFGEPAFGNTYGENFGMRIAGVLTAPETAQYHFFVRSDDASQFFLNTSGAAIPDPKTATPIAEETDCCDAFYEPDSGDPATTSTPISLQAGRQYGFVYIVKEGGGGDWGQVAMRKVGDTTPAADLQPIRGAILAGKADPVGAVATITQAPQSATVAANEKATFSVTAQTASPYTTAVVYQWYRNGAIIAGANSANYSIPVVSQADNGAKFKVLVAVPGASATSSEATLTVTADNKAPTVANVIGSDTFTQATITFSEPVTSATAAVAANYTLSGGLTVSAAQPVDPTTVRLTTSKQAENTPYTLTVKGVQDNAGNAIAANTTAKFGSFVFTAGKMKYEYWSGIGGTTLDPLKQDSRYPNNPTGSQLVDSYEAPIDWADNFGARVSGWITPATSGNYVFYMSADDGAELYLSTDDNPANKKLIAQESGWSGARQWVSIGGGSQVEEKRSDQFTGTQWPTGNTITLQAGRRYYTELIYKEGGGGDNGAATWKLASAPDVADTSLTVLIGQLIGTFAPPSPPTALNFTKVAKAGSDLVLEWSGGTLESADEVIGPWSAVANARSPATIPIAGNKKFYRLRQ